MQKSEELTQLISKTAKKFGFYSVGISRAEFLEDEAKHLQSWLDVNKHAGMTYMEKNFEKRINPALLMDGAISVVSLLYNYYPEKGFPDFDSFKISKYAYGKDYHFVIKRKLKEIVKELKKVFPGMEARVFTDSAPILERAWASRAGLGWIGKNTNLITREQGSYFFIAEILINLELDYNTEIIPDFCKGCTECIKACPTGALKPYSLDSSKCISYWTIENNDENIPEEFKGKFNNWIFGCDICQEVCPWNKHSKTHLEPDFCPPKELFTYNKQNWIGLSKNIFDSIFKQSAIKRAGFTGLKRNIRFHVKKPVQNFNKGL